MLTTRGSRARSFRACSASEACYRDSFRSEVCFTWIAGDHGWFLRTSQLESRGFSYALSLIQINLRRYACLYIHIVIASVDWNVHISRPSTVGHLWSMRHPVINRNDRDKLAVKYYLPRVRLEPMGTQWINVEDRTSDSCLKLCNNRPAYFIPL